MGTYDGTVDRGDTPPATFEDGEGMEPRVGGERSLGSHLRDLFVESVELVRDEVALAKAEVRENVDQAKRGAMSLAAGTAILTGGLLVLLATAVMGLGLVMPYWAAGLIVGGVFVVAGLIALAKGRSNVRPANLTPDRTLEEMKRDTQLTKEHL